MEKQAKIYVAGHKGLVGSALIRKLLNDGYQHLICRSSMELDLRNQNEVNQFFEAEKPDYVFLAAAKVGGIRANQTYPAEFIYDNLLIETNVIHTSYLFHVKKLLFLGSSCIYPKDAPQPYREESLLTGTPEPTNRAYAIAKIAGLELCRAYNQQYGTDFISAIPAGLYGPNDNFSLDSSHVIPALIRKFHEAKTKRMEWVTLWGTGQPVREYLHVDDLADACLFLLLNYDKNEIINIGCGEGITIRDLAYLIREIVGFEGEIKFDAAKPDGAPMKVNDITKITGMGWTPRISLSEGIADTYSWYKQNIISS